MNKILFLLLSLTVVSCNPPSSYGQTDKIPVDPANWYQLNTAGTGQQATTGLRQLTDSVLTVPVFMGWGKLLSNYDCYYEFKGLSNVKITRLRLYDGGFSFGSGGAFTLYARASASAPRVLLATFTGRGYPGWVDISLPAAVPAQYLVVNTSGGFPTEIEMHGSWRNAPVSLSPRQSVTFADMAGINSFVWDFMESWDNINIRDTVFEPKMGLLRSFTQYRDYVDWEKLEPQKGRYTFNPTQAGNWDYDKQYRRIKQEGKTVLVCLKTVPGWFLEQYYPADQREAENVPAPAGADLLNPASYLLQAKLAFQFAARYGRNTSVDRSLLNGVVTGYVYPSDPSAGTRTVEAGLNLVKYIECENERDKWWKGRKAYQTAREYAANLSAFYDGNKNTMGPGVGVKNADTSMKVVIGGTAATSTDYIRGIIDWCKEFRGYKADGSVNLCFDVINYHCYSFQSGAAQYANAGRGAAPELSGAGDFAAAFVKLGKEYNKEVWITEGGYDVNQQSPLHAPAIGARTPELVQADWILRTALLYARQGIKKMFFYQTYDENVYNGGQFASSGLLDRTNKKRKPAADFLLQVTKLAGNYVYKETVSTSPVVDRYELNGKSVYALMMTGETGQNASYTLQLLEAAEAKIYYPKAGADAMDSLTVRITNGKLTVNVSETPIFVKAIERNNGGGSAIPQKENPLSVYPNPVLNNTLNVYLKTDTGGKINTRIIEAGSGKTVKTMHAMKTSVDFTQTITLDGLPATAYIVEVEVAGLKAARKFTKFNSH